MKNLQYIILLLLAIAGILVGLYYANSLLEPVHRDQPGKSGIEPPSDRPLRVFFERELYTDKIAYITPRERAILMNHAHQFRLKALFEPVEILEPAWQEGNITATLSCRVSNFPNKGTESLVTFRLINIQGTWFCDLFASESHRLFALFNVLDHPVGLLLAYFNCDDIPYRRSYIAEEATNPDRTAVMASQAPIPFTESNLVSIDALEFAENGICGARVTLSERQGHEDKRLVYLKSFLGKWFLWRDPPDSVTGGR